MEELELRRLAGQEFLSRARNEEKLAIEIVARDPKKFMQIVAKMKRAKDGWDKQQIFKGLDRDEKLGFVFIALSPRNIEKVMDYLAERM